MTHPKDETILGLIPARGGSKGIPRKNLAPVAGRPLLAWTVEAARASGVLDRIVVSTEDAEIAQVARTCGAEVPFMRPAELARDDTPGLEPVVHALETLARDGYRPEWILLLQPTSPLRTAEDIRGARALRGRPEARSVISVCEASHPPAWMRRLGADLELLPYFPREEDPATRQELPKAYALNGALYLTHVEALLRERTFTPSRTYGYVMPPEHSIDIDSPWDLRVTDLVLRDRSGAPR